MTEYGRGCTAGDTMSASTVRGGMRRREFIGLAGGTAAWPLVARAQRAGPACIGFLGAATPAGYAKQVEGLRAGLRDLGYTESVNLVIEFRWAEGQYDRLSALLADLIRLNVDAIIIHGTPAGLAAKQATSTIPIVFASIANPLGSGIVKSLARPGGNLTGLTYFQPELASKRLELLKETIPDLAEDFTAAESRARWQGHGPVRRLLS
jgi:putative ABC transport system substrate-binding protein